MITLDERVQALRVELKGWEKQFAAQNGGKKPDRDDIKKDEYMADKYKEYDRLRRNSTKKIESQHVKHSQIRATPKKSALTATPQKPQSQLILPTIPLNDKQDDDDDELEPTPAAIRFHLGPTPQRDGQILSLFDDLSSTASKPSRTALSTIQANIACTPSKPSTCLFDLSGSPPPENVHLNHTPASSSKRFLLDSFVSTPPLKRKRDDDDHIPHATPSSSNKGLSTPAFLRRSSNMLIMDTLLEEAENDDADLKNMNMGRMRQPPFKKRGIVRSLSSIIQGMRKQEDDKLDEELDMLRDMEGGDDEPAPRPVIQVEDSQVVMPLGPDQGDESDESEEEEHESTFRKPWKKKGQKRQTKRTNMRPGPKPKPPPTDQPTSLAETEEAADKVAETQLQDTAQDLDSDDDDDDDEEAAYSDTEAKRKRQVGKTVTAPTESATAKENNDGVIVKAAKKISASAHANFRRLNIKNKNSKASGKGKRFGRR